VSSNLFARKPATVVNPTVKYLGNKKNPVTTIANAARVFQTITDNPFAYAEPFKPTICSVDKLVHNKDTAIRPTVKLLAKPKSDNC
jgi:hypothetical protein